MTYGRNLFPINFGNIIINRNTILCICGLAHIPTGRPGSVYVRIAPQKLAQTKPEFLWRIIMFLQSNQTRTSTYICSCSQTRLVHQPI
jgi:hypothetical protein